MPVVLKIIHEREKQNKSYSYSYSESVRAKWFCRAFNLGFLQLKCKASLISNSNLELASSVSASLDVKKYETCYPFGHVPQS